MTPIYGEIAKTHLYNSKVFIFPPWLEIYHVDHKRKQTWEEATLTFAKMKTTYSNYGYAIIEVPKDTVENRVKFILNNITGNRTKISPIILFEFHD